ncbi:adapter molecule Crk-like [Lineus longissimus]|uniref:adapter molecule Crk-like n=1 Tax=Lineus longissimus TaxID=88925 RepID=UPI002B4D616F
MAGNFSYSFDPDDQESWFFGDTKRDDTNLILNSEGDTGVFLVRGSTSIIGDFVLCVKEDTKISHYIINKITSGGKTMYKIGDKEFPDIPTLLTFYKNHYLDTTPLVRPALRKVIGKYRFTSGDADDLKFEKGEVLSILRKDEDQWWTARNSRGEEGQIPVPYVEEYTKESKEAIEKEVKQKKTQSCEIPAQPYAQPQPVVPQITQRQLPAMARVIKDRIPNAYDPRALELHIGDMVKVIQTNMNGEWEGLVGEKQGLFPFTHVQFIDSPDGDGV